MLCFNLIFFHCRSLVALSLVLALLLFKPAPLYILDEVDSALDLSHTQVRFFFFFSCQLLHPFCITLNTDVNDIDRTLAKCCAHTSDSHSLLWCLSRTACSTMQMYSSRLTLSTVCLSSSGKSRLHLDLSAHSDNLLYPHTHSFTQLAPLTAGDDESKENASKGETKRITAKASKHSTATAAI